MRMVCGFRKLGGGLVPAGQRSGQRVAVLEKKRERVSTTNEIAEYSCEEGLAP